MRGRRSAWPTRSSALSRGDSTPLPARNSVVFLTTSRTVSISVLIRRQRTRGRERVSGERGQLLLVIRLLQRRDDFLHIALQDLRQTVERETDPMIRHAVLGKVIRADPLTAVARTDLALARRRIFRPLLFF